MKILNSLYLSKQFQLVILHGRKRIGKTALLNEFSKGKHVLSYTAMETNQLQNIRCFNQFLRSQLKALNGKQNFSSFQEALDFLFELSVNDSFVFMIDNFQYLAKSDKNFSRYLFDALQKYKARSRMMLILSSTTTGSIEQLFLKPKGLLHGQETCEIRLKPFTFFECQKYFRNVSSINLAYIYGIYGGIPDYLLQIGDRLSVEENIKNTFLNPSSRIFEEPGNYLRHEVREPSLYNAILTAIASGAGKLSEIASAVSEETSVCAAYLKTLLALELVRKDTPLTDPSAKKTIYKVNDALFRFWYYFLPPYLSEINNGQVSYVYHRIEPKMGEYMKDVFAEICKQYLQTLSEAGKTPLPLTQIGCWWGADPFTREKIDLDILAVTENPDTAVFGSCFWRNEKVTAADFHQLKERSDFFSHQMKYYYLFSKTGFTKDCYDLANDYPNLTLVSFSK